MAGHLGSAVLLPRLPALDCLNCQRSFILPPIRFLRWRRRVLHTFRLAFVFMRTFHVARYVLDWSLSPAACSSSPLPFCRTYISFKACENIEVAPKITIAYIIRSIFEHVGWGIRNGDFGDWWQLSDKSACRARKHKHKYK